MSKRISIQPVTRVEGHARITVNLDDAGTVQSAYFHVAEFRGFEKLCEGRPFQEMPGLMSRICGICPVSHVLASSKAGDMLLGVEAPPAAVKQRRLANYAQILQSHALSFFHLSSPDLLLGMDSPPEKRNIIGLLERDPEFLRRGIRLRQFGQRIIELVGGKRVHPGWSGPGGVHSQFTTDQRDEVLGWIPEALDSVELAIGRLKAVLDPLHDEIEYMGNFPSLFMGMVSDEGGLEFNDGLLRIVDAGGNCIAERLDPRRFCTFLGEASENTSYMKFPFYRPFGYPQGHYRVGPLARLNVAKFAGTSRADKEFREVRQRGNGGAVCQSFHFHLARLIEMLHSVERIEELMADPDLFDANIQAKASLNRREGVGASEAPRGTLFHRYQVDADGRMTWADLLIATSQNNYAINFAVEQTARRFLRDESDQGALNRLEAAIRCFDPCLSCSTHAAGVMPLIVDVRNSAGETVRQIRRD